MRVFDKLGQLKTSGTGGGGGGGGTWGSITGTLSAQLDLQAALDACGDFMADGSVPMTGDLQMGGHKVSDNSGTNYLFLDAGGDVELASDGSIKLMGPVDFQGWNELNFASVQSVSTLSSLSLNADTSFGIHNGEPTTTVDAEINFVSDNGGIILKTALDAGGVAIVDPVYGNDPIRLLNPGSSGFNGAWIDIPANAGASGIGSGGAGANAWIAYVAVNGQWFSDAQAGDIAYRNTMGSLRLGVDGSDTRILLQTATGVVALQPGGMANVGIGTESPGYLLDVNGDINAAGSYFCNGSEGGSGTIDIGVTPNLVFAGGLFITAF